MSYQATLLYTEPLVRKAVFAFWRRSVDVGFVVALPVVALGFGVFVAQGDDSWFVGVLGTAFVVGVAFAAALYSVHYRNSLGKLREMGSPQATLLAEESSLTFTSGAGTATLPWSAVKEIWQFADFWLLRYSKAHPRRCRLRVSRRRCRPSFCNGFERRAAKSPADSSIERKCRAEGIHHG